MTETTVILLQWLVVFSFFLLVIGFMFGEAAWIGKKCWATFGKAFVFSALSNFIGFAVGLFVFFIVLMIFMMLALDGSLNAPSSTAKDATQIGILIFSVLLTPILLIFGKRFLLSKLKIQTGKAAWVYALTSSILIFVVALGVPILLGYFIFT